MMEQMGERERLLLDKMNGEWRKLKALRLRGDTRAYIEPARKLLDAGLVERVKQGREYLWRRKDQGDAFRAPEPSEGENADMYAERVKAAYAAWVEAQRDPLPDLVANILEAYTAPAGGGMEAAVSVLRHWLEENASH